MNSVMANIKREKLKVFLKNSGFFNQQIFEEHPEGYYALDLDGRFVQVNKQCEIVTGYVKEELYDLCYKDLLTSDCVEIVNAFYDKSLMGKIQNYQCTIMTKNHMKLVLDVTNAPIIGDDEILGIYGIAKDITIFYEQKRKVKESELLHRNLVEHSLDGIVVIRDNRLVYTNQEAASLLGASNKLDIIGESISKYIPINHNSAILNYLEEAEKGSPSALNEEKIIHTSGNELDVEVKAIPTVFEGCPAVYLIIRDITEKKIAHELMMNSEKLSVAGQLAAGIAHEIRNPITAIKGFLQLMEGGLQYKKEFFSVIFSEINRIELILSELLSLAKPPLDNYRHKNIGSILQHVVALTRSQATLHNIHITTFIRDKHLNVLCDENKLKQVFINFIKNAIEAMPNGGNITASAEPNGNGSVIIKIVDQGTGIPTEMLREIGKPFFTTKENGTGLGIMVSYEIIKHHNGEVKIDSNSNGTTISVILPISK
jgi:two-component system sporulation sensor kinase A